MLYISLPRYSFHWRSECKIEDLPLFYEFCIFLFAKTILENVLLFFVINCMKTSTKLSLMQDKVSRVLNIPILYNVTYINIPVIPTRDILHKYPCYFMKLQYIINTPRKMFCWINKNFHWPIFKRKTLLGQPNFCLIDKNLVGLTKFFV